MEPVTLKDLEWIHDCVLISIAYDASTQTERVIRIALRCPSDLGFEPWQGRRINIIASKVAFASHVVWGTGGSETVDAIRPGLLGQSRQQIEQAKQMGAWFPEMELTLSCHSGATLEIICKGITVEVER